MLLLWLCERSHSNWTMQWSECSFLTLEGLWKILEYSIQFMMIDRQIGFHKKYILIFCKNKILALFPNGWIFQVFKDPCSWGSQYWCKGGAYLKHQWSIYCQHREWWYHFNQKYLNELIKKYRAPSW